MSEQPVRLDPSLLEYLCLALPRVFAPIHQRNESQAAEGARSEDRTADILDVSVYEHRTVLDVALNPESTAIFFGHYAHLFISDIQALNDLARQSPSRLDYLLPRVVPLIPQPPVSAFDVPFAVGAAELTSSEQAVLEGLYWPKDPTVVEHEKQFWARENTENWADPESREKGLEIARKKWQTWSEEYFVTRWWALISDFHSAFTEAVALGVASAQKARRDSSDPKPDAAGGGEFQSRASGPEDPIEAKLRSRPFHTRKELATLFRCRPATVAEWLKEEFPASPPRVPIPNFVALRLYRRKLSRTDRPGPTPVN